MTAGPNGRPAFLGEDKLRDLAIDLPVEVKISQSAAVMILPKVEKLTSPNRAFYSAEIFNATMDEVTVEITIQSDEIRYDMISEESHYRKDGEIIPTYKFTVPPETRETFSLDVGK